MGGKTDLRARIYVLFNKKVAWLVFITNLGVDSVELG